MTEIQTESIKQDAYLTVLKLARQYKEEGLFSQAEDFYKQAIAIARNLIAAGSDQQRLILVETLSELASFYSFQGKDECGQPLWMEILDLSKNILNAGDSIYARSVFGLAGIKEKKGEVLQAEQLYNNLLEKQEDALGSIGLETCPAIKQAAAFYFRRQNYAQAEALYLKALALEEFHLGTCSAQINNTVDALINIFRKQKKWRLAEYMFGRQKDILSILHGEKSICVASCELRLAELFRQSGQIEKAIRSYKTVLDAYTKMFGDRSKFVLSLQNKLNQISSATISFDPNDNLQNKTEQFVIPMAVPIAV